MVAVVVEMEKVHHILESLHLEMDPVGAVVPVLIVDQTVLKEQVAVMVIRVEWDLKEEILLEPAAVVVAPVVVGMMLILVLLGLIQYLTLMLVEEVMVHPILIDMEILLLIIHLLVIFTMLAVVQEDGVVQLLQIMRVEDEVVHYQNDHMEIVLVNLVPLTPEVVEVEVVLDQGMVDQVEMVDLAYV